jgi:protease-4
MTRLPILPAAVAAVAAARATAASGTAAAALPAALRRRTAALVPTRLSRLADRRRLAVLPLRGVIGGRVHARDVADDLDRLRRDGKVRAVMLDIDSPGGGAVESEAIYVATRRLAATKPVLAYMRGTGASGAYFVACGATRILAFPSAIVGSIGVISARPVLVETLRRLGASVLVTKTGPFKDLGAPWREPTDAERAKEQSLVDAVFRRFSEAVGTARGLDGEELARVTTGEVWLADEAVRLGLVDGVCDPEEALDAALALAGGLRREQVRRVDRRHSLAHRLGVPGAGMGPPSARWIAELEGWMRVPRALA